VVENDWNESGRDVVSREELLHDGKDPDPLLCALDINSNLLRPDLLDNMGVDLHETERQPLHGFVDFSILTVEERQAV